MAQKLETFSEIITAVMEAVGIQSSDTLAKNKIKRFINMVYVDEVVPFKRWMWLEKSLQVIHKAYYSTGTVSVTPSSTTATLSVAPNVTEGSFKNYKFSVDGSNKVYTISAHTAESTTLTLSSAFQETLNATATYKIWRDRIDLPTDAKETTEITHAEHSKPCEGVGPQGLRKLETASPKAEGFPTNYSTGDFFDPSVSDDEYETDRYRQVRLYPAITDTPVTLTVDYIQEVTELDDDEDEPLMPVSDRIVLFYGATAMAQSIISRNEEAHDRYHAKYEQKLARMAGEREDGYDTPSLKPKSSYLSAIRKSGLKGRSLAVASLGGASSVSLPSYLVDVRIDGATIIDNVTVDAGVTIDGRDLSVDGALLDSLASSTSVTLTDNTTNQAAITWVAATYNVVHMQYSIKRGSDYEAGMLTLLTDGSAASIAQGAIATIGSSVGVTFSVDVTGGSLRLLSTTTSTGTDATLEYRSFKWLAD